ncbi:MAG: RNA polymerase sigma factor [Deltaproteobacteria bacterium]|nr:RNA polymerase sigma factor [Deltaproteobacteria bacterium]
MNNNFRFDSDSRLIQAIGEGNHRAFEFLVLRYNNRLFNFILRYLGDRPAAEDLVQEAFIRVYTSAHRFKRMDGVRASSWIFKIAYNLSMNEIKRSRRYQVFCNELDQGSKNHGEKAQSKSIEEWEIKKDIISALNLLPKNQRAALLLRVNEGFLYKEISEILNCSISSVESLIFRARKRLKENLKS